MRELADGLLARGHEPVLVTSHPGAPSRAVEDGLPVIRLPRPPQGWLVNAHYELHLTHVPLTYAALTRLRPGLTHAVYPTDALAGARWRRRTGAPAVLSYMGIPDPAGIRERRRRREILLAALHGCDAVVALSDYAAEAFRWWLGYEPRVIPPGVDLEVFRPRAERATEPTIICSAAAWEPRKHVGLLVKAMARVRRELPDARLILSRPPNLDAVRRAGVEIDAPGVVWRDLDDRTELARAYSEAWVAALPSTDEAFGLVLAEALACGTPVVGYADGAIPELIDRPAIGRLFHALDPGACADVLLEALALVGAAGTAEACRARVQPFSTDVCAARYLELYRELAR
jgi:glycosyltransferase involved in cell wall biosynthesis